MGTSILASFVVNCNFYVVAVPTPVNIPKEGEEEAGGEEAEANPQ